jgi:hypothetical protein
MKVDKTERIYVNLNRELLEDRCSILKAKIASRIDDNCTVYLNAAHFEIKEYDSAVQTVTNFEHPIWEFDITPKKHGLQDIIIEVAFRCYNSDSSKFENQRFVIPRTIKVIE